MQQFFSNFSSSKTPLGEPKPTESPNDSTFEEREEVGARDHVSRDDEEDVHAQEAVGHQRRVGVEENDQRHRDGAERVDLGKIPADQ